MQRTLKAIRTRWKVKILAMPRARQRIMHRTPVLERQLLAFLIVIGIVVPLVCLLNMARCSFALSRKASSS